MQNFTRPKEKLPSILVPLIRNLKLTAVFLFAFAISLNLFARSYSQSVTLNLTKVSLVRVLHELRKQTGYVFFYKTDVLNGMPKVNVIVNNADIAETLDACLSNLPLQYSIIDETIVISRKENKEIEKAAIEKTAVDFPVKGKVTTITKEPLPGATVKLKGSASGTITDEEGNFILNIPSEGGVLVISFIGFETFEVAVNKEETNLEIILKEQTTLINELVVLGYGTVKRSDVTGSVSSISSDEITQVKAISNLAQTLQGQAAGVQVSQRSGQPGENISIIIRGNNSIQASNSPLYVVDGLPLDGLTADLNPTDIETIEVLKDASSTAIYGSRGANGVLMITTKKGKEGRPLVSYNGYYGVQTLRKKLDLIDATEFATLQNEVAANDGQPQPWTQQEINALGQGTDWQDLVYNSAPVQNHDISVSGGNSFTKYYTSLGYFDQDGIINNSGFKRYSLRTNLDQKLSEKFTVNVSLSLQQSNYAQNNYFNADGNGGVPFTTMVMPPTQGVYDANGKYTVFTGVPWGQTNPYALATEEIRDNRTLRVIGNGALTYQIVKALKFKVSLGVDGRWGKAAYYAPKSLSLYNNGGAFTDYSNTSTIVNENILNYFKTFNAHSLDVVVGFTYQTYKYEELKSGTFSNFQSDIYQYNNLNAAGVKPSNTNTGFTDNKLISYLGRVNYSLANKYLLTLTGRYDGSSKFSENDKFAFFPSGAIGWRVSEESFMDNVNSISDLKLRASYGVAGNQGINEYNTLGELRNQVITLNNAPTTTYYLHRLENNSLKWETTRQFDIGIDLGLIGGRLQLTADYYSKKTTDLLLNVTLPPNTGFTSALQNAGAVGNKGFEFQLNGKILNEGELKWNTTFTYSSNRTKILDLGKDAFGEPITYKEVGTGGNWFPLFLGQSMQQLYGYNVIGVYQTDAEAVANGEPTKRAGNYKFQNTDGNAVVDGADRIILSNFQPKFTYGFNNNLSYKNLNLSILIVGSFGNDIANEFRKYNITLNGNWTPTREGYESRWIEGQDRNTFDKPSATSGSDIRDYANSLWVENGSYLRVRDITFAYDFSPSVFKRLGISSSQLYVSGQNLITITNYSGYDPESSWDQSNITPRITGWDRGVYPATKSIICGWKINF